MKTAKKTPFPRKKMCKAQHSFLMQVEEEREKRGLSMSELSKKAFGSETSYYSYVDYSRNMTGLSMNKLAVALGMKLVICLEVES